MPALFLIDDKWVPLYRVVWVAQLPHFCGSEECEREGQYEVRLDNGELRAIVQEGDEPFKPGDRVRLLSVNGQTRVSR